MKVLITGANGQLGTDLARECTQHGDEAVALSRAQLDVTRLDQCQSAIDAIRPDVVINCAAWTAVDDCESDPQRANLINGAAVGFLGAAATKQGIHIVQVSTDYVFDGLKSEPYLEMDRTNPQSVYGRSKLVGEEHALTNSGAVVRTSWVCSRHGGNMVATVLRLAADNPTLRFVSDQRGNPTFTTDLARACRQLASSRAQGIFHVTNAGSVSWFEFAQAVLQAAGDDQTEVLPIATADLVPARPAPRPANSVLASRRFEALGYDSLRDFREPLGQVVRFYQST